MNNKKGYTLIEILVAMGILAIMAIPILDMYSNSIKVNIIADNQIKADLLAQKYMEIYKTNNLPENSPFNITDDGFNVRVEYSVLETDVVKTGDTVVTQSFTETPSEVYEMYLNTSSKIVLKNNSISNENLNVKNYNYKISVDPIVKENNLYDISWSYIPVTSDNYTIQTTASQKLIEGEKPIIIEVKQNSNLSTLDGQATSNVNFEIFNGTDKTVQMWLYNDVLSNVNMTVRADSKEVKIFRNLTKKATIGSNSTVSYEVNVVVSKGGTTYTNLRSVIDKE